MTDIVERLRQFGDGSVRGNMMCDAADEIERLRERINNLNRELHQQVKDWCDDDEAIKQQALRVLPKEVVEGDSVHVPRMGELAEMMADEIEHLRKNNL